MIYSSTNIENWSVNTYFTIEVNICLLNSCIYLGAIDSVVIEVNHYYYKMAKVKIFSPISLGGKQRQTKCVQISHIQTYFTGKMSGPANQQNKTPLCKILFIFKKIFFEYRQNDQTLSNLAQFLA